MSIENSLTGKNMSSLTFRKHGFDVELTEPDPKSDEAFREVLSLLSINLPLQRLKHPGLSPFLDYDLGEINHPQPHCDYQGGVIKVAEPHDGKCLVFYPPIASFAIASQDEKTNRWDINVYTQSSDGSTIPEITGLDTAGQLYDEFSRRVGNVLQRFNNAGK